MNNRQLRKDIARSFDAPAHARRAAFLYEQGLYTSRDRKSLILSQLGFIHKGVWALSIVVLILASLILQKDASAALRFSSLIMPFVAGAGVFTTMRSRMYRMGELESVTIMSLRGSIFTKFAIISVSHLMLMVILSVILGVENPDSFTATSCHIVLPYLLTSALCMEIERTKAARSSQYFCFAVSCAITVLVYLAQSYLWPVVAGSAGVILVTATLVLLIANVREYIIIYKMEERKWNFVLTE